jgi:DNA end-binding protein Ku
MEDDALAQLRADHDLVERKFRRYDRMKADRQARHGADRLPAHNKVTGRPVAAENIVKGYAIERGHYVVLRDEDFKAANPKATQTVEILAFVDADTIAPQYFEKPYRLVPGKRGEKGYALLREAFERSGKVGVAQVVIHNLQHLAVLMPNGPMLALNTLRWADEVLGADEFTLPRKGGKAGGITAKELALAQRLIADITEAWDPRKYKDTYRGDLLARVKSLATAGRTRLVKQKSREDEPAGGAQIIDLMAALKRSLGDKGDKRGRSAPTAAKRAASEKLPSRKTVRTATRKRA